ncbi:hypothetical protein [Lentzea guizhouensis]|uniref:hypothetical protein n=1 Tax=Lentzea guizhouensis TaxID=1586287 RepID=UPI0012B68C73|nr:hypothetical protein [Lentzea guizhouensis]
MSEQETLRSKADWQAFTASLCTAASTWDTDLARVATGEGDDRHVPISPAEAEDVLRAIAALCQRMGAATASIVRASAEARLDPAADADELTRQVESLELMAHYADAMHRAADLGRAVVVGTEHA